MNKWLKLIKKRHIFCGLLFFFTGFLLGGSCKEDTEAVEEWTIYTGYLVDGEFDEAVTILDEKSRIRIITQEDSLDICFFGRVEVNFFGVHDAWGPECRNFKFNPKKKQFRIAFQWGVFNIPIKGEFYDDAILLTLKNTGELWLEKL